MPYALQRTLNSLLLLVLTISFVFFAGRMIGDPALNMLGSGASPAALDKLRVVAGLNDPIWQQYLRYLGGLLTGDFGVSYRLKNWGNQLLISFWNAFLRLFFWRARRSQFRCHWVL